MPVLFLLRRVLTSLVLALGLMVASLWALSIGPAFTVRAANITVNSLTDVIAADDKCTLREAIIAANTDTASGATLNECAAGSGADVIDLTGLRGTILLNGTLPTISSSVVVNGPGAAHLTIDGGSTVRIFSIASGDVVISGLTVANGYSGPNEGHGGGILNSSSGVVTVISSTFLNNQARGADGQSIYNGSASGCCFGGGGAIFHDGTGVLKISQTIFVGNVASGGNGGQGGYARGGGGGGGAFGGALFSDGGEVIIASSTFSANQVVGGDGGNALPSGSSAGVGGGGGGQAGGLGGGGRGGGYFDYGENGEFGGGGGGGGANPGDSGGSSNFGGGHGGIEGAGGGGAGLGGSIFHNSGLLTVTESFFWDNQAAGGQGNDGRYGRSENGQGLGQAIFNRATASLVNNIISNTAPIINNVVPAAGAAQIPLTQTLRWEVTDSSEDAFVDVKGMTVKVAFGQSVASLTETESMTQAFDPLMPLEHATTYYWVITATDGLSVTSSGLLSFTTAATPSANFDAAPRVGVAPLKVQFENISTATDTYLWGFGDGQTSTAISPSHEYATSGTYTVSIQASGPGGNDWLTRTDYIAVHEAPQANFTGAPRVGTDSLTVVFTNTSAYADSYQWNYGDGETSAISTLTHTHSYSMPGAYTVTLTAANPYSNNVLMQANYIILYGTPVADFLASPLIGGAPLPVYFTNKSHNASYCRWDFGDGFIGYETNPNHLYRSSGLYTVTLTAFNPASSHILTRSGYITVGNLPEVNFYGEPTVGLNALTVTFTNTSQLADTYLWNYGDGITSATAALTHSHFYTSPGHYTISLAGINIYGDRAYTRIDYIAVYLPAVASFTATPLVGRLPMTVAFTNTSRNATNFWWNFGDDTTDTAINPTHIYQVPGIYTVSLVANNPASSDILTQAAYITAYETPLAGLAADNDSPTQSDQPTKLVATTTTGSNAIYQWAFGDGSLGTGRVVFHVYPAEGDYTATVTASNSVGVLTATTFVKIRSPFTVIATDPAYPGQTVLPGSPVSVTFSRAIDPATVGPQSFKVWGQQTGIYTHDYSISGNRVVFEAQPDFKPGEEIMVSLTSQLISADGIALTPRIWQFRVRSGTGNGHGTGLFVRGDEISGGAASRGVVLGDVDSDGDLDASVATLNGNEIWLNDGTGNFSLSQDLGGAYVWSTSAAFGDVNSDGHLDIVVGNYGFGTEIWLNDGTGIFSLEQSFDADNPQYTWAVALGDLNNDGDLDIFTGNGSGREGNYVWLNDGDGHFTDSGQVLGSSNTRSIALGDLDGDGDLDAFVGNGDIGDIADQVWFNDGNARFSDSGQRLGAEWSEGVALGDVDGDGDLDAFVACDQQNAPPPNRLWLNDGHGFFTDSGQLLGNAYNESADLGDLDGDGDLDAFISIFDNFYRNEAWLNDGEGNFTRSGQGRFGAAGGVGAALGDLDRDGDLDAFGGKIIWLNQDSTIPAEGGSVTPTPGVTLTANSGTFSDTVTISYAARPVTPTGTLSPVGLFYELEATYLSSGLPAQPEPGQHYIITVTYRPENIPASLDESTLALYYWEGTAWIREPTSMVDVAAKTITAAPNHFSLWAALVPGPGTMPEIFLPVILKKSN